MLANGQRIELDGSGELKISEFESYCARICTSVRLVREPTNKARPTRVLLEQP